MNDTQKKDRTVLKGTLAAGAATAVLLGGFGTFALWQDTVDAGVNHDLASGALDLGTPDDGVWTLEVSDGVFGEEGAVIEDISTFIASPGDVVEYNATVPVTVTGSDILANLTVSGGTAFIAEAAEDYVNVTINGEQAQPITPQTGVQQVEVAVTVEFDEDTPGQVAQDLSNLVNLSELSFDLDQVTGPASA